ncbi:MAG: Fur family transcriptional regulator [Candidatus Sericytochromatia bacterium]|nr:Fur family transcriptional regulator [Candidatus Sericytochromatia bacterium]
MSLRTDLTKAQADLRQRGYRVTPQRDTILRVFHGLPEGTHLSADELQFRLKQDGCGIGLATTYRTLKLLASLGLLRELDFAEGHKHYELATGEAAPHHHLICTECSGTVEFEQAPLLELGQEVARAHGYRLHDVQLKVFGTCPACISDGSET